MKMKTKHQASALAIAVAAFAVACADPTSNSKPMIGVNGPNLDALTTDQGQPLGPGLSNGEVRVCKTTPAGDPALNWSFTVSAIGVIGGNPPAATTPVVIAGVSGQTVCAENVFLSTKTGSQLDQVTIVEQALPANWALTHIHIDQYDGGPGYNPPAPGMTDNGTLATRTAVAFINNDMGRTVTFTNDFTAPPTTGCTYTKGWYQNPNGAPTVIAVDGRTIAQAQAIFAATPGQPGSVTWGVGALTDNKPNALLNLYQQFLAALQNLGGDANEDNGPLAVDNAIDAVQAATGGAALHISMLAGTDVAGLTATLSAFNEGTLTGWPHCEDEEN